jgi:GT2 family glycosyltransferase
VTPFPKAAFRRGYRLGLALKEARRADRFERVLAGLRDDRHPSCWLMRVGLCQGIFAERYDPVVFNKEWAKLRVFRQGFGSLERVRRLATSLRRVARRQLMEGSPNRGGGRCSSSEIAAADLPRPPSSLLPTVSVIVAVYNAQDTIRDCVESLLALDYPPAQWELIVVDNASRDATPTVLEAYRTRCTVLHERVRGPAAARNTGLRQATGDVVAFTDSDCVVDPQWLRHLVSPLQDPTVGIAGGRILAHRPCSRIAAFGERVHDHRRAIEDVIPPYAITMNWASPRADLDKLGGFNARLLRCSDVDLAFRVVQAGYRLVYEPNAVIYHRNRSTVRTLAWEGYRHGYHGVAVRTLHRQFLSAHAPRVPTRPRWSPLYVLDRLRQEARSMVEIAATRREIAWALLFNLAKTAGRLHGTLAAIVVRRGDAAESPRIARRP